MEKCQRKKCDAVGMVRNEKKGKFSPKKLGDFFRGVVYRGTCVGELLGELLGEMQKKGWKNFLGGCWGSCEPQQILGARNFGGHFWGKCKKRGWGGVLGEL